MSVSDWLAANEPPRYEGDTEDALAETRDIPGEQITQEAAAIAERHVLASETGEYPRVGEVMDMWRAFRRWWTGG